MGTSSTGPSAPVQQRSTAVRHPSRLSPSRFTRSDGPALSGRWPSCSALAAALCFGIADFIGGLSGRANSVSCSDRSGRWSCACGILAPFVPASDITVSSLMWGAVSGAGTGLAVAVSGDRASVLAWGGITVALPCEWPCPANGDDTLVRGLMISPKYSSEVPQPNPTKRSQEDPTAPLRRKPHEAALPEVHI